MNELARLTLTLPPDHTTEEADMLSAFLARHVPHGWAEESLGSGELRCTVHSPLPEFCTELSAIINGALPSADIRQDMVKEENWVEAWKEFFTPVLAGEHFLVLAPWMRDERAAATRTVITIEPKTAFGTGHHATTALCLEALSRLFDEGVITPGMRFLDLGTGSGILGIGAAKLGLCGLGLDIDPASVDNAKENRALNNVPEEDFQVARGSIEEAQGPYDLVLANILSGPLVDMAPAIASLPGRDDAHPMLVLSGLLDIQADVVEEAYIAQGRAPAERIRKGEWCCLVFR